MITSADRERFLSMGRWIEYSNFSQEPNRRLPPFLQDKICKPSIFLSTKYTEIYRCIVLEFCYCHDPLI